MQHNKTTLNVLLLQTLKRDFNLFSFPWLSSVCHLIPAPLLHTHTISFHTVYSKSLFMCGQVIVVIHLPPACVQLILVRCWAQQDVCVQSSQCRAASLQSCTHRWLAAKKSVWTLFRTSSGLHILLQTVCAIHVCLWVCVCFALPNYGRQSGRVLLSGFGQWVCVEERRGPNENTNLLVWNVSKMIVMIDLYYGKPSSL